MNPTESYSDLHRLVLHLPILTTFFSIFFATQLFTRYREKGGGPHLLWWGLGMVTYGIGTFTEAYTTLFGWQPVVFRFWYVAGAFLGGYPLAQGSIYLLMSRRFADWSARIVVAVIAVGAAFVFLTPLDYSLVETHRLSGEVMKWSWIRLLTPFINIYSVLFLSGGAALSAWRFFKMPEHRNRYLGNILIATGAILPAIGGTFTRFGVVEVLYFTELLGLLLIYAGYRKCVAPAAAPVTAVGAGVSSA